MRLALRKLARFSFPAALKGFHVSATLGECKFKSRKGKRQDERTGDIKFT